jgi:cyanate lyase
MTLVHYKQKVIDYVSTERSDPQAWRLYALLNNKDIKLKRLLNDMVREGLISIHHVTDPSGKVRRHITKLRDCIEY